MDILQRYLYSGYCLFSLLLSAVPHLALHPGLLTYKDCIHRIFWPSALDEGLSVRNGKGKKEEKNAILIYPLRPIGLPQIGCYFLLRILINWYFHLAICQVLETIPCLCLFRLRMMKVPYYCCLEVPHYSKSYSLAGPDILLCNNLLIKFPCTL